jgi:hypothetical protein
MGIQEVECEVRAGLSWLTIGTGSGQ